MERYRQEVPPSQEVEQENEGGGALENVAKIAGIAGATAALAMGGNKLRQRMKSGKSPLDGFPGLKDLQKRAANEGVRKVNLNKVSDFDPVTGAREPTVAEYNVINKGASSPTRSQQELTEYLEKPLGKMGTPQQRPADAALESYVEGRRAQTDPVDRLSAELEEGFQAQRVKAVKEELGGQVLEELQREGRDAGSFAQGYVRKEGYVDSSPVQTQSTDSMDIDGYQEHREVKRVLQRNEDLDIGSITAKSEPNFGTANPEQVDNSIERVAARVQEAPIRERSGGGFNQETTLDQMQQNVDSGAEQFAAQYKERMMQRRDAAAERGLKGGRLERSLEAEFPYERQTREGAMQSVAPKDLEDSPLVERTLANFGPDAEISTPASNTSIRGTSRIDDRTRAVEPSREMGAAPDVGGLTKPISSTGSDIPGYKRETYQGGRALEGQDPYAVKERETDLGAGMGIYGQETSFAAGPQSRQTGEYTATARRVPSQVFAKDLELQTPSGRPFANPVTTEGASEKQTRIAPQYDRMSDDTLRNVSSQSSGPSAQKLENELQRRQVSKASMQASDRIMEINRTNPPERAKQMVNDYLNQLRGGQ